MRTSIFLILFVTWSNSLFSQAPNDTVVVGKIVGLDSVTHLVNKDKNGYQFYYGCYHLKIEVKGKEICIVKIFNMIDEFANYQKRFSYKLGESRIFYLYEFNPCKCEIPKIDGYCDNGYFYPLKSRLIVKYDRLYRVIHDSQWK